MTVLDVLYRSNPGALKFTPNVIEIHSTRFAGVTLKVAVYRADRFDGPWHGEGSVDHFCRSLLTALESTYSQEALALVDECLSEIEALAQSAQEDISWARSEFELLALKKQSERERKDDGWCCALTVAAVIALGASVCTLTVLTVIQEESPRSSSRGMNSRQL